MQGNCVERGTLAIFAQKRLLLKASCERSAGPVEPRPVATDYIYLPLRTFFISPPELIEKNIRKCCIQMWPREKDIMFQNRKMLDN